MIGVLTVLALLAAAVIPTLIRRLDREAWEREKSDLQSMADSYTQFILHNQAISNYAGIPAAIATEMALPLSAITTTPRGWDRAFLVDPDLRINNAVLPYSQTNTGAASVTSARVMILSSLAGQLPVVSGDDNPDFQAIWNTPEGGKPSVAPWDTWTGRGEDLLIKKLNLEPLFYQLILVNHDGSGASAKFTIDGTITNTVPTSPQPGLGWNAYYLDGTVLGLYDSTSWLQTKYLLRRSISFLFEAGEWRGQIQGAGLRVTQTSSSTAASNFVNRATTFYNKPTNPNAQQGSSQNSVLVAMYTFMFDYIFWASQCPHFDNHSNNNFSALPEYRMLNDNGQNSGTIDSFSGANGILK